VSAAPDNKSRKAASDEGRGSWLGHGGGGDGRRGCAVVSLPHEEVDAIDVAVGVGVAFGERGARGFAEAGLPDS
jgi:hypothetical protein